MWTKLVYMPAIAMATALVAGAGCGSSANYVEAYDGGYYEESYGGAQNTRSARMEVYDSEYLFEDELIDGAFAQADGGPTMEPAPVPVAIDAPSTGGETTVDVTPPEDDDDEPALRLIYTGTVTLAVYHVDENQESAIAIIEELGGYASYRDSYAIEFRVPAEHFRTALDALGTLGDVLDTQWSAQDVSEQYRDVEIRLRNALQMRERLEALLAEAQTVQDALAIEAQLERVTLTIEQMRGQLRFLQDRIAYSTITLYFSPIHVADVPGEEYRLPFPWLNTLGVEYLLSL